MTTPASFRRRLLTYTVLFAFAVPVIGPAAAQVASNNDNAVAESVSPGEDGPQTRGLFLLALLPVFAQMVGSVGGNLIDILFDKNKPPPPPAPPAPAAEKIVAAAAPAPVSPPPLANKPMVSPEKLSADGKYYAGVAYATFLVQPQGGEPTRVDADTYRFRTGERFVVRYVANMPGRVEVTNINPRGRETALGSWAVSAGQQVNLPDRGSFEFTGSTGDEGLRIAFTPCTSGVATRDIAINAPVTVNYGAILPTCGRGHNSSTRDIAVKVENGMGYAVSQLEKDEVNSGSTDARVFMVRFQHAAASGDDVASTRGWLVTPEEADQPTTRQLVPANSDPEGPKIEVRVPGEVKEVKPPVTIDVAIQPRDGHKINFKTLKITYLKVFNIDITDRMKPYLTPAGIFSDNAKLPPGDHSIEISVQDDEGRRTVERFDFKVLKP